MKNSLLLGRQGWARTLPRDYSSVKPIGMIDRGSAKVLCGQQGSVASVYHIGRQTQGSRVSKCGCREATKREGKAGIGAGRVLGQWHIMLHVVAGQSGLLTGRRHHGQQASDAL